MAKNTTTTNQTTSTDASAIDAQALADANEHESQPVGDATVVTADDVNRLTDQLARTYVQTERERKEREALASDLEAREIAKMPRPTTYKVPILHPLTEALAGYAWVDGNGNRVDPPEDER